MSTGPTSVFNTATWAVYHAELSFTGQLIGGAPSDPKLVEGHLGRKLGITDEDAVRNAVRTHLAEIHGIDPSTATDADIAAALEGVAEDTKAQVFKRLPGGHPYIEGRQVKAAIKEAVAITYPRGEHKWGSYRNRKGVVTGVRDPRAFIAERVFVDDDPIVVGTNDNVRVELAVGHIKDWKGETRSTLGYFECVDSPVITFTVRSLDDCVEPDQWARIWTLAEHNGLGARRSQGAGQFKVTRWDHA